MGGPHRASVSDGERVHELDVPGGAVLRDVLVEVDPSPNPRLTGRATCGGRGPCSTCGVGLADGPPAGHWHDRLAAC
ncbi:MAG: hypothetical protein QXG03_06015 [Halalkalicoccus sp.]